MTTFYHTLGYDEHLYRLKLEYDKNSHQLAVSVDGQGAPWPRLVDAIKDQLLVYAKSINGSYSSALSRRVEGDRLVFSGVPEDFALNLNKERIGRYSTEGDILSQTWHRRLTATEIRRMGTFHKTSPYPQDESDELLARAKKAVFTDFHTHSSGQISPYGLLNVGLDNDAYYPVSLLKEAGIDTSLRRFPQELHKEIPRVPFPPRDVPDMPDIVDALPLKKLSKDDLQKIAQRMAMPTDRQSTYSEMENDAYRFRYPLSKPYIGQSLTKVAEEYVAQGVKHAELTTVGLDNPNLLKVIHTTTHAIDHNKKLNNFSMHYLLGIPRNFSLPKIKELLEKAKILSESPYITGVDFIGYEVTKTREFAHLLDEFCQWANENRPGFTVRVHAGENDKNLDNVKDFIELAEKYPNLHFRVGHGVHGMNKETLKLASSLNNDPNNPRLTIESNPDSVISLNNIDCIKQIPFDKMVRNNIPFVVSSDSGGTYGTDAEQLGLSAYYAGMDAKGFDVLENHQRHLMETQRSYSKTIADKIPNWDTLEAKEKLVERLSESLKKVPLAPEDEKDVVDDATIEAKLRQDAVTLIDDVKNTPELNSRTPITFVGANGDRWNAIDPIAQRDIAIATDMLAHAVDPDKVYFAQGRTKLSGLSYILNDILDKANTDLVADYKDPFYNLGMLVAPRYTEADSYKHLTHIKKVSDKLLDLSDELVNHTIEHNGILLAAGGASFTRDIILKADQRGIRDKGSKRMMFLFSNAEGASQEKSSVLNPDYAVNDGRALIEKMYKLNPSLFRAEFDINKLDELYAQSEKRAESYNFDAPADPDGQEVQNVQIIEKEKGVKK